VWVYDLRTNKHFTLKTRPLKSDDLQDFVTCYHPENRHERTESERFKYFSYEELIARDKANLDIFWLKDDSLDIATARDSGAGDHRTPGSSIELISRCRRGAGV
jgi:type I restriction-modification system DNA methylase subunit